MRRIYLIDCPGVVYPTGETDTEIVLKGVVRVELVQSPEDYVETVLARVKKDYVQKTYKIQEWADHIDFLEQMARRTGKLLKGGEPDVSSTAKMVLNDWQRGKIPFFVPPDTSVKPSTPAAVVEPPVLPSSMVEDSAISGTTEEAEPSRSMIQTGSIIGVVQDLSHIRVRLEYSGDDVRPLEQEEEAQEYPTDSEDEGEEEGVETEGVKTGDEDCDTVVETDDVATNVESGGNENVMEEEGKELDGDDGSDGERRVKRRLDEEESSSSDESYDEQEIISAMMAGPKRSAQILSKGRHTSTKQQTASGTFTVVSNDQDDVRSTGGKRRFTDSEQDEAARKLTSKERRRIEREQKQKKVGQHYYAFANIKNRNRGKRDIMLDAAMASRGHSKKGGKRRKK
jgi:nuclear GTP-binding protein